MVRQITATGIGKFKARMNEWRVVGVGRPTKGNSRPMSANRGPTTGSSRAYGSNPARRAATTASPRVWVPSFRMADRR